MTVGGFQKLTLLDYPGKVACTVFTAGCQLRCPFCHNASLVTHIDYGALMDEEAILSYLQKRNGVLDGVCVTGGEPLLQKDLPSFLRRIKALGLSVKLDTNGASPDRLRNVMAQGLVDYVAMDVKNDFAHYPETVGIPDFDVTPIKESIRLLMKGQTAFEFRTTVVAGLHTEERLMALAKDLQGAPCWFLQSFVDSGDLIQDGLSAMPESQLYDIAKKVAYFVPNTQIRGI